MPEKKFSERPEWADIKPIPQDDGPQPVVAIAYTDEFKECMDYLRAVMRVNEMSERAFDLTVRAIDLNPANYTCWQYRRLLLKALKKDLKKELDFLDMVAEENPKNYQIWHHRRVVVEWLNDASRELPFTAEMIEGDSKNYHAWTHRQWVVSTFKLWEGELAYVDELLGEDLRNNSAWNHRYFVVAKTSGFTDEVISKELETTFRYLRRAPGNESAWNYLRGCLKGRMFSEFPAVEEFLEKMLVEKIDGDSAHIKSLLVDILEERASKGDLSADGKTVEILEQLAKEDPIRAKYWNYRASTHSSDKA
eukprot:Colp12_sorted_trinity150504_noHs@9524